MTDMPKEAENQQQGVGVLKREDWLVPTRHNPQRPSGGSSITFTWCVAEDKDVDYTWELVVVRR